MKYILWRLKKICKSQKLHVFLCILCLAFAAVHALCLFSEQPYIIIEAKTGIVKYRVQRQNITGIVLKDAITRQKQADGTVETETVTGVLSPSSGCIVTYRLMDGTLSIMLEGDGSSSVGFLKTEDGDSKELAADRFTAKQRCDRNKMRPLPIAGATDIGAEIGAPSGASQNVPYLYGGNVYVLGRTTALSEKDRLYPRSDATFPIPAGGRISSGDSLASTAPAMYGIAEIDGDALRVSLSTVTDELHLFRPGRTGEHEILGIGFLNQLLLDPSLVKWILGFSIFGFLLSLFSTLKWI